MLETILIDSTFKPIIGVVPSLLPGKTLLTLPVTVSQSHLHRHPLSLCPVPSTSCMCSSLHLCGQWKRQDNHDYITCWHWVSHIRTMLINMRSNIKGGSKCDVAFWLILTTPTNHLIIRPHTPTCRLSLPFSPAPPWPARWSLTSLWSGKDGEPHLWTTSVQDHTRWLLHSDSRTLGPEIYQEYIRVMYSWIYTV